MSRFFCCDSTEFPSKSRTSASGPSAKTEAPLADGWPPHPLQSSVNLRIPNPSVTPAKSNPLTFQELILRLQTFWAERGCVLQHPSAAQLGAATMPPETFLRVLGPHPY